MHYEKEWHSCKVTYFIVPLYPKIYLEAFEAKKFILNFLLLGPVPINDNSEILLRLFLMSSRSFKNCLINNKNFDENIKDLIIEKPMPKFVWITELSTKELMKNKTANGLLILDATETNIYFNKPLLLAGYQNNYIEFNEKNAVLINKNLYLPNFSTFESNLKFF